MPLLLGRVPQLGGTLTRSITAELSTEFSSHSVALSHSAESYCTMLGTVRGYLSRKASTRLISLLVLMNGLSAASNKGGGTPEIEDFLKICPTPGLQYSGVIAGCILYLSAVTPLSAFTEGASERERV